MSSIQYLSDIFVERHSLTDNVSSLTSKLTPVLQIDRAFSILKSTMEEALSGGLDPAIYVMSADCGTNKSRTVQAFLADWKAKGFAGGGSAIIFVNTLAEVDAYKDGAGLDRDDYAIHTKDPVYKTRGAGVGAANEVPVLFATHSKARKVLTGLLSIVNAAEFHYRGQPRTLAIWEEAFLPAEYASFELDGLQMLPGALVGRPKEDIAVIAKLLPDRAERFVGSVIHIPLEVREIADGVLKSGMKVVDRARRSLEALAKLAGSSAHMIGSDEDGWTLRGIGRSMPPDMGSAFVLDASARLTRRYADWSAYGMKVVQLEPAAVHYGGLAIHWWNRGCGKTALRNKDERWTTFRAVAELANGKPGEGFLLVMKKEFCTLDAEGRSGLPHDLRAMLSDPDKVKVTTWGRHLGSNEFRHIKNVVLLGSYSYPDAAYDAIAMAARGPKSGVVSPAERRDTEAREFMHNVYQAVCRIRVRNRIGANCSPANAYLIMNDSERRREQVHQAFPGCSIESWNPVPAKKERKADKIIAAVLRLTEVRFVVSFKEVIEACGSADNSYLTKPAKDARFKDALRKNGISILGKGPSRKFIRAGALASAA